MAVLPTLANLNIRSLSSGNDDGDKSNKDDDQNFFLNDEDSLPRPPSYVRDSVTGKWTDQTHAELSPKDKKLLNLDDVSKSDEVMRRMEDRLRKAAEAAGDDTSAGGDFGTLNEELERVAHRIQDQKLAMGTVGRDSHIGIKKGNSSEDGEGVDENPLTPREIEALKTYAQKEHNVHPKDFARIMEEDADLIPHNSVASGSEGATDSKQFFDADLDLAYLNPKINRRAFKDEGSQGSDDPFADLLPSDLNPARKVNRRHAKPLPKRLLHHNNLSLLRRYTTPGGKIMNRVQSRLGAKDQRKIAKLVKRARHLGLIPHLGQWKFEDHGYLHAHDEKSKGMEAKSEKKDWEVELEQRGLWPLQNDTDIAKKYYDMENMMDHIGGPRGGKKRMELESLMGGAGALVKEDINEEEA